MGFDVKWYIPGPRLNAPKMAFRLGLTEHFMKLEILTCHNQRIKKPLEMSRCAHFPGHNVNMPKGTVLTRPLLPRQKRSLTASKGCKAVSCVWVVCCKWAQQATLVPVGPRKVSVDTTSYQAALVLSLQSTWEGCHTLRGGVFLPSKCLLESIFLECLPRTLLRTLCS